MENVEKLWKIIFVENIRKRGLKKIMEGHTIITSLHPNGEPKSPKGVKMTVVNQCGCYVRDHIPISFKLWKKSKATDIDADSFPRPRKKCYGQMSNGTSPFRRTKNSCIRIGS